MTDNANENNDLLSPAEAEKIAIEHMEYADRLLKSMLSKWGANMPQDDITSLVGLGVTEASKHFKPSFGVNFKTFVYYYLKGLLVKEIDFNLSLGKNIALTDSGDYDTYSTDLLDPDSVASDYESNSEYEDPQLHIQKKQLLEFCFGDEVNISDFEKQILIRHYVEEFSVTELAEMMDYSRSHLSRVKSSAIEKIKNHLKLVGELGTSPFEKK